MRLLPLRGLALLLALLLFVCAKVASAAPLGPVIVPGREAEVTALLRPYFGTGTELAPGYSVGDVKIEPREIRLGVTGPNGAHAEVILRHPSAAPDTAERTASFAVTLEGAIDPPMSAATKVLVGAIRKNDVRPFFGAAPMAAPTPSAGPASRYASPTTGGSIRSIPRLLRDGVLLAVLAAALTLLHLRRTLREEPRIVAWSLAGLVVVGASLRLSISVEAPMNVWPYDRVVPLARAAFEGPVLGALSGLGSGRIHLTDLNFKVTTLLAIFTPLAFFAHARYVLRDTRGALFAVALLVVLPNHIRFARADSEFIQSLATSSLTFVTLYTALRDPSRVARAVAFCLLPILSLATYFVRPENLFFFLVDVGAILLSTSDETPRRRRALALFEVSVAAVFAFVVHLLGSYQSAVRQGLSIQTIRSAVTLFFDVRLNTLINPLITPPGLTLLAVLGAISLVRAKERGRAVFLVAWLLGFFVVHSFVRPSEPAMQARYHLHLVTPLLLLAASALPLLRQWPRRVLVAGAIYLAASPLLHLRFERDTQFNEMNEFSFLRATRASIPDGCTVLEFSPTHDVRAPSAQLSSRWSRLAVALERGRVEPIFRVVNLGRLPRGAAYEQVSEEAAQLLEKPPPCLMLYLGLTCFSHRPPEVARAPVCDAARAGLTLLPVATTTFRSRVYDEVLAGRLVTKPSGETNVEVRLAPGEEIALGLYRVTAARVSP